MANCQESITVSQSLQSLKIIRLAEVLKLTGLSRSTIYALIDSGKLKRIKLGERSMGFLQADVEAWIHSCIKKSAVTGENHNEGK
jgi:prophage regulatory protein